MRFLFPIALCLSVATAAVAQSTQGILDLVQRRLPQHVHDFSFTLENATSSYTNITTAPNDHYVVGNGVNGTIAITGNSPVALASGLHWYLANIVKVDIYWFIGSRLHLAPSPLPKLNGSYAGSSIVPWRYHFNTVTFSYTAAFWTWEDWELELDWLALRGVNLPLAWVGYEKILYDTFLDAGFTDSEIISFLSGPAFQAWNRFGNIQGSWNGSLSTTWIDSQYELQKQIVQRMVSLGMTPVLPSFAGFVPRAIDSVYPNASFVNGSQWNSFPTDLTNVTFLEPTDPHFAELQSSFISKQAFAYGNVTHIYALDLYNENTPQSSDLNYLKNTSYYAWQSLKQADPQAVWLQQAWLFYSSITFWTNDRVEAYLSGVEVDSDLLLLDLFSETQPQWQRTNSYYGKPWIWCELHDYGGNMGLYGQVMNVTVNPIAALANSSSLIGFGLTMEGQEGNEIMYDILLDQAWSKTPINTATYFSEWVSARYSGSRSIPSGLYQAWDMMRTTVYNNTKLTTQAVTKSIFELSPNSTGLLNRTGHHATTIEYQPSVLVHAWSLFYNASVEDPTLWDNPSYTFDLVDITRQIMANAFYPLYSSFVAASNSSANATYAPSTAASTGASMLALLTDLDMVLTASNIPHFNLAPWIALARAWASYQSASSTGPTNSSTIAIDAAFYEYNARNQITLWGPTGQISDYASKQWGGLISSYYVPRWSLFINNTLNGTTLANGANTALATQLLYFEEEWQTQVWGEEPGESYAPVQQGDLAGTIADVVARWPSVFA